jgi:hypothetical protein
VTLTRPNPSLHVRWTSYEQHALEERARRAREVLFATEALAADLRRELAPDDAPVIGERTHRALDFINEWVCEARTLHRLAERELAQFLEHRGDR